MHGETPDSSPDTPLPHQQPGDGAPDPAAFLLFLVSLTLTLLFLVGLDRFVARPIVLANNHAELIFAPHAIQRYISEEFNTRATINNLGFRGVPTEIRRNERMRVVAIGDSFTFGYGAGDQETWPYHLEQALKRTGLNVEVLNLGRPGAGPRGYEIIAANALPLLKPDLVLLGILQSDDLDSSYDGPLARTDIPLHWNEPRLLRLCRKIFPNFTALASLNPSSARSQPQSQPPPPPTEKKPRNSWEKQRAKRMLKDFSVQDRARFEALPEDIKQAFQEGMINPFNIQLALHNPDIYAASEIEPPTSRNLQYHQLHMTNALKKIADTAATHNAALLAILVPHAALASSESMANSARLGFTTDPKMLTGTQSEDLVREACEEAGVPFLPTLQEFRTQAAKELLFFPMDQHFNPRGAQVFAEQIAPAVADHLRKVRVISN